MRSWNFTRRTSLVIVVVVKQLFLNHLWMTRLVRTNAKVVLTFLLSSESFLSEKKGKMQKSFPCGYRRPEWRSAWMTTLRVMLKSQQSLPYAFAKESDDPSELPFLFSLSASYCKFWNRPEPPYNGVMAPILKLATWTEARGEDDGTFPEGWYIMWRDIYNEGCKRNACHHCEGVAVGFA